MATAAKNNFGPSSRDSGKRTEKQTPRVDQVRRECCQRVPLIGHDCSVLQLHPVFIAFSLCRRMRRPCLKSSVPSLGSCLHQPHRNRVPIGLARPSIFPLASTIGWVSACW